MNLTPHESIVTEVGAAAILGCSVNCLRSWRGRGWGPAYTKVGRLVRYSKADLTEWLHRRRVQTNSDDSVTKRRQVVAVPR
ncbi:MAG: helix-turn-helix domain-containing protein [Bryobacteraceae bacterium]